MRSRLVPLLVLSIAIGVAGFGLGGAGAVSPVSSPTTAASAWAIRISIPGQAAIGTSIVSDSGTSNGGVFTYPADGSLVSAQTTTASATTSAARFASAKAESGVTGLSLFGGEITADGVTARASAGTGFSGAGGNQLGSGVSNLVALGQPVTGTTTALAEWGTLELDTTTVDRAAPAGTKGYQGRVVELDVRLTAEPRRVAGRHRDPDRLRPGCRADAAARAEGHDDDRTEPTRPPDNHDDDYDRPDRPAARHAPGEDAVKNAATCSSAAWDCSHL